MPVAFAHFGAAIAAVEQGAGQDGAGICAQTHRRALGAHILLIGHQVDHRMSRCAAKLTGVGVCPAYNAACKFDHGDLHAQADAEIRHAAFTGKVGGGDHSLDAAAAKASRHDDAVGLG